MKNRLLLITVILLTVFSLVNLIYDLSYISGLSSLFPIIGLLSNFLTVVFFVLSYLQSRTKSVITEQIEWDQSVFKRRMSKFASISTDVSGMSFLSQSDKDQISARLTQEYKDAIFAELDADRQTGPPTESQLKMENQKQTFRVLENLSGRLIDEIASITARSNINLAIGSVTTLASVLALIYYTRDVPAEFEDALKLISFYIPRLSVVIFVEVFAFFFLRLYRDNLNEIKYYRNEVTNIDFRLTSLRTALINGDNGTSKIIINDFNKIDRNAKLKKGETTIEIETSRHQNINDKSFVNSFKSIIDSILKSSIRKKIDKSTTTESDK